MAKSGAVWGIDLGQSALRALRCRIGSDDKTKILADAYDFVEYPTIVGQPDADAATIYRDALKTFLSRNSVKDDAVAISTPGQNGLARFVKLPPVEEKKIPDIVQFEARQQIPFKLEEVVWDYQVMPGGNVEDGFALDAEVGLFAMKRDQVIRTIKPYEEVGVAVDFIQLAPLAIFNAVRYDVLEGEIPATIDPDNPPPWKVIMSVGTDTTDIVLTNGFRVWQRSVPLGGNHFTKAISKQLKTTFSKAEHLKRNAQAASPDDAKALFKAMRPVFGDMVTEVQTSLRYFSMNVEKTAEIDKIVALGNAMKLPGLRRFLEQNIEIPVLQIDAFRRLAGASVVSAPAFKDNLLSYAGCYGLALQGLRQSVLTTNLVPPEVHRQRLIDEKKPWALAGAAALMLGFTINYFGAWNAWYAARFTDDYQAVKAEAGSFSSLVNGENTQRQELEEEKNKLNQTRKDLVQNEEGKTKWAEIIKVINDSLPKTPGADDKNPEKSVEKIQPDITKRADLHITELNVMWLPSEDKWFKGEWIQRYNDANPDDKVALPEAAAPEEESGEDAAAAAGEEEEFEDAPTGPGGYVIEIVGHHFSNETGGPKGIGGTYVQNTLIEGLKKAQITVKDKSGALVKVKAAHHPTIVRTTSITPVDNPAANRDGAQSDVAQPAQLKRFDFTVQFWWQPDVVPEPPSATDEEAPPADNTAAAGN